jgi:hypothetical protein
MKMKINDKTRVALGSIRLFFMITYGNTQVEVEKESQR